MARPAPAARQAPPQRPAAVQRRAPQIAAPSRQVAPRTAAPSARSAPAIQRAAPAARAATRAQQREQRAQQRQQTIQQRQQSTQKPQPKDATPPKIATPSRAVEGVQKQQSTERLQQLQQQSKSGRIGRADRRELRQLQQVERTQKNAETNQKRLDQLQQQAKDGKLNRRQSRELRRLENVQKRDVQKQQAVTTGTAKTNPERLQQLQQQAEKGRLNRADRRELRQLQRADKQQTLQKQQSLQAGSQLQQRQSRRTQVTQQQVTQGRFASSFQANATNRTGRRDDRRAARLAAKAAWQLGLLASYVPWRGPVYWPYAYNDVFYYTFWPDAYEPSYWAYAYDDMFDGIFFPDGAPYVEYAYEGTYLGPYSAPTTTGSAGSRTTSARSAPGRLSSDTRAFCAAQAKGVTAWPFEQIEQAVQPTGEQKSLLDDLKKASADAAAQFKEACPDSVPMTPPGRLQTMTMRLQATLDTVKTMRPALTAFYESLSDEQKARFNEIGPELAKQGKRTADKADSDAQASCSSAKAGLSGLAAERIEQIVQPTDAQENALDRLDESMQKAVDTLQQVCPTVVASTPVGRLEVMEKRLEAMIEAANTVRPALEDFYAGLNNEQKAKFNRLGRETAQSSN